MSHKQNDIYNEQRPKAQESWTFRESHIKGEPVGFTISSGAEGIADVWTEANACLIAAAPELLEACKEAHDELTAIIEDGFTDDYKDTEKVCKRLMLAIAKAEGK